MGGIIDLFADIISSLVPLTILDSLFTQPFSFDGLSLRPFTAEVPLYTMGTYCDDLLFVIIPLFVYDPSSVFTLPPHYKKRQ